MGVSTVLQRLKENKPMVGLVFLGLFLRTVQYLHNKSVWHDEIVSAIDLASQPFSQLQFPLKATGGGYGYMVLQKMMITAFGFNEWAIRFFPYIASCLSVIFFFIFLTRHVSRRVGWVSLALFVLSDNLIYYAAEFRQYSVDVWVTTVILVFYHLVSSDQDRPWWAWRAVGLGGAVLIWFSHVAVVLLFGLGCVWLGQSFFNTKSQRKSRVLGCLTASVIWLTSFAINYWFSLVHWIQSHLPTGFLTYRGHYQFIYFPVQSLYEAVFNLSQVGRYLCFVLGIRLTGFNVVPSDFFPFDSGKVWAFVTTHGGVTVYILGLVGLALGLILMGGYRLAKEKPFDFGIYVIPIVVITLLSAMEKYPFLGRHLLFLFPMIIVLASVGIWDVYRISKRGGAVVLFLFLLQPVGSAAYHIAAPRSLFNIRPVLSEIATQKKADEKVVVLGYTQWVGFYKDRLGYHPDDFEVIQDAEQLRTRLGNYWVVAVNQRNEPLLLRENLVEGLGETTWMSHQYDRNRIQVVYVRGSTK